jgi:hypothetical protein
MLSRCRQVMVCLLGTLLILLVVPASARAGSQRYATAPQGPVVLLGVGGLRWDDVDGSTPTISRFASQGAVGWLAVRSVRSRTCPVDGWLATSAGRRAAEASKDNIAACGEPRASFTSPGGPSQVDGWATFRSEAETAPFKAHPGLLGDTLASANVDSVAVGPGAVIALARSDGAAPRAYSGGYPAPDGLVDSSRLATDVQSAVATKVPLIVVDLGSVIDSSDHHRDVHLLDERLDRALQQLPSTATVLLASLNDAGDESELQLVAGASKLPRKAAFGPSLLTSSSTRQPGIAQATDILPTLLDLLSVAIPRDVIGSPLHTIDSHKVLRERLSRLNDIDQAARSVTPIVPRFFAWVVVAQFLIYGCLAALLRRQAALPRISLISRATSMRGLRQSAIFFACIPAATYLAQLVPWWRSDHPGLAVAGATIFSAVILALLSILGPWRQTILGSAGAVGGLTALVLALDTCTGSRLSLSSLMGIQPILAGRFYGFGNVAFALFATGALLLAIAIADPLARRGSRRTAVWAVAAVGVITVLIDGLPWLGADFGGPPALIPAFSILAISVAGRAVTLRSGLIVSLLTIATVLLLAVLDWLRPAAEQTHLGHFVQSVIDGELISVINRKASQNLVLLTGGWLSVLIPFFLIFVIIVLARPGSWGLRPLQVAYEQTPTLRQGLGGLCVLLIVGSLLNDSGAAVPAVAATILIPILVATSAAALERSEQAM